MASLEKKREYVVTVRGPEANLHRDLSSRTTAMKTDPDQIGRRWNDLAEELVGEIMVRLSSADLIRFAACCTKFWSLMPLYNNNREIDQLPWIVKPYLQLSSGWEFELFDPLHKTPYSYTRIDEITGQFELNSSSSNGDMKVLASQHGWLLWSWEKQIIEQQPPPVTHSFLVVSPFTKQFMILPDLEQSGEYANHKSMVASFSAEPSSPGGCIYFIFRRYWSDYHHVTISTYHKGDSEWKTVRLNAMASWINGVVYYNGRFYCCGMESDIAGAYNVVSNEWKHLLGRPQPTEEFVRKYLFPGGRHSWHSYLLVCEGKLLFVCLYVPKVRIKVKNDRFPYFDNDWFNNEESKEDRCLVYEYSEESDVWVEKSSLGGHALFLCPRGSFSVSATSDIANRVYYYRPSGDGKKHYYSLEDGKSYPCGASYWPSIEDGGTWIKPPHLIR